MAETIIEHVYRLKGGEQVAVEYENPFLERREPIVVYCTDGITRMKIGDGVHRYNELDWVKVDEDNPQSSATEIETYNSKKDFPIPGNKDLIYRSIKESSLYQWNDSKYRYEALAISGDSGSVSTDVFEIISTDLDNVSGDSEGEKILNYLNELYPDRDIVAGSIAIVKKSLDNSINKCTAYVFNGTIWTAMDGNYDAEDVILNEDLIFTSDIGVKKVPTTGFGTIDAKGKSLEAVLKSILAERKTPSTTEPTVTLKSSNIGAKEVGTNISIAYNFDTTKGSYTYDSDTGVTFDNAQATFNGETIEGISGTFKSIQVTDDTNLKITGSISNSDGNIPHDNLGDEYIDGQIKSKEWNLEKGTLTGYRAWFCGYKNGDNAIKNPETGAADATLITGDQIRTLGNSANGSWKSSMNVSKMQQMFFAAPSGKGYKPSISDSKTGAPQTVLGPMIVYTKGANDYITEDAPNGIAYDVWYVNNTLPATGDATLNIKK